MMATEEFPATKSKKKKALTQLASPVQVKQEVREHDNPLAFIKKKKGAKSSLNNDYTPPPFQQTATSDSLPGPSGSGNDYRALRHKYLLLEEESLSLEKELGGAEAEIKTLEDEKLALLDQLVVLEGLVNPSELGAR